MADTFGVVISAADAQLHLLSLTRSLFPTVIAEQMTESKGRVQEKATQEPTCARPLSVMLSDDDGNEVGASITPTSGHKDKHYD